MAKILVHSRIDRDSKQEIIPSYSRSFVRELIALGHDVFEIGEGHGIRCLDNLSSVVRRTNDLFIDLDCGRNKEGNLSFQLQGEKKIDIPSAVRFIDTHGYPSLHHRISKNYDHVFFAVYDKRDLFTNCPSTHWCPNASDDVYFDGERYPNIENPPYTIGFFGSKGGLDRANVIKEISKTHRGDYYPIIREVGKTHGRRWPATEQLMAQCRVLFNKGQKHDGPNQRVIESMLMQRPLISDRDKRDGMHLLFEEGTHYLGWESKADLAQQLLWCLTNEDIAENMAMRAYKEVKEKHLIKHRVQQILEVCLG